MAASDVPATAVGAAEPSRWSAASSAADVVPHLAYGAVTPVAYEMLARRR